MGELRASDRAAVRAQLGREPTTRFTVVARCAEPHPGSPGDVGHPLVIRNHPIDAEGRPFPTRYWLTCPDAVSAVARLEADGWIRRLSDRAEAEPDGFGAALRAAHAAYAADRAADVPKAGEGGGVAGTRVGVKCLHAHYAYYLAGGDDPVGSWVAERLEPFHPSGGSGRLAAVDLGTNSIRLLVVEPRRAGAGEMPFLELARDMVITRIGQGVDRSGRIEPEALARTLAVLERYGRRARALGAERIRVTATSAVRDAANRDDLEAAVRLHAGSELRVASGESEAELCFLGATSGLDAARPVCVLDIGGGSTEFVVGSARPRRRVSTQMGSVRLTERHVRHDPPTDDELNRLFEAVDTVLEEVERAVAPGRARTLVAVAGTSTTVQAVGLDLPVYDPEAIHRTELPLERAEGVLDRLASMTTAERAALSVMAPGREDVIVAGAAILVQVMRRFGFDRTVVSERDVLDGLILELLGERVPDPSSEGSEPGRIR
jgi:exopolyphosphatase / guanosine-5'-triphosphate,3'-diphosphate pyrophosphatase